jgi:membrane protein implicated in regulation of membrane protease activity
MILVTPLTVWGITLLAAGELPGLPLAVGGAVLEVAAVVLTAAALRVRRTLSQETVSRDSLLAGRRVAGRVRLASLVTLLGLVVFGFVLVLSENGGAC